MKRTVLALVGLLGSATLTNNPQAVSGLGQAGREPSSKFTVVEASIADMRAALEAGRVTSAEIVQQYLGRIATYEDLLHAALHVNRNALREAEESDRERAADHPLPSGYHNRFGDEIDQRSDEVGEKQRQGDEEDHAPQEVDQPESTRHDQ